MSFRASRRVPKIYVNVSFKEQDGKTLQCFSLTPALKCWTTQTRFAFRWNWTKCNLNPGKYTIQVDLVEGLDGHRRGEILYKNTSVESMQVIGALTGWDQ